MFEALAVDNCSGWAAQAGAKHVYGIERSAIVDQAELIVKDNGYDDRVTIIKGAPVSPAGAALLGAFASSCSAR